MYSAVAVAVAAVKIEIEKTRANGRRRKRAEVMLQYLPTWLALCLRSINLLFVVFFFSFSRVYVYLPSHFEPLSYWLELCVRVLLLVDVSDLIRSGSDRAERMAGRPASIAKQQISSNHI